MSRANLMRFIRDENASVAMEYLVLVGVLGVVWVAAATEYRDAVIKIYYQVARALSQVKI